MKLKLAQLLTVLAVVFSAIGLLAQEDSAPNGAAAAALLGGMFLVFFIFFVIVYVYMALALQTIAKKTNTENAWMAWVPIVNIVLMLNIARKPIWWIVLCLIPFVNIIIMVIIWMGVAEARQKPNWWGILMIVPVVNLVVPGYLAWSE